MWFDITQNMSMDLVLDDKHYNIQSISTLRQYNLLNRPCQCYSIYIISKKFNYYGLKFLHFTYFVIHTQMILISIQSFRLFILNMNYFNINKYFYLTKTLCYNLVTLVLGLKFLHLNTEESFLTQKVPLPHPRGSTP